MKLSLKKAFFPLIFVLFSACETGQIRATGDYRQVAETMTDAIEYEIEDKDLNAISIVLVKDQEIVWADGFGFEDHDRAIEADANTVYRVGSVSKLFTDIGIMQLVEKGEVSLDAPITDYLPEFTPRNSHGGSITLRQLMSHRSGMLREPRVGNYFDDEEPTLRETVDSIIESDIVYAPESRIKYSNAGIAVVGYVLERLTGNPFANALRDNVLIPMGLEESAFEPTGEVIDRLADATMWTYDGRQFPAPKFELGMSPAGSMYSSVKELGQFMKVLFKEGEGPLGPVISKGTLTEMLTSQFSGGTDQRHNVGFGLGFSISEQGEYRRVGHGGAIYGFSTQLYALLEAKLGVAVTSSVDVTNTITGRLSAYALDCLLSLKEDEPLPEYAKTEPVEKTTVDLLSGHFVSNSDQHLRLIKRIDSLVMENDRIQSRVRRLSNRLITDDKISFGVTLNPSKDGTTITVGGTKFYRFDYRQPLMPKPTWKGLIGEYGLDHNILYVYEDHGRLIALMEWIEKDVLTEVNDDVYRFPEIGGMYHGEKLIFSRDENGFATQVEIENGPVFKRREVGTSAGETFRITPLKPIEDLRASALDAVPPREDGKLDADLVELKNFDKSVKYDIRYATTNNFMSARFYKSSHAFMQRPAAEALIRAHRKLNALGYGLLIYDAYRPWYVTKMFYDATPINQRIFVANPANGSRHNRGCAVDLTLYEVESGKVVEMVGGYDEFTDRSYPDYLGGTSRQRWHRDLLRKTMESEGFSVYKAEWWHFDYESWNSYPIMNLTFEELEE